MTARSGSLVSVCLPVFNGQRFLAEAIDSVFAQSYTNFELIIVDDCSTDDSAAIALDFASKDSRVRVIQNSHNAGLFENYNICMRQAKGSLIKPFAQDDILLPQYLEKTISILEQNPSVGFVSTDRFQLDAAGRQINPPMAKRPASLAAGIPIAGLDLLRESLFPVVNHVGEPTCVIFRNEFIGDGFDTSYFHVGDLEYWLRIALNARYFHIGEALCGFRHHEDSCTARNMKNILFAPDMFAIGDKYSNFFEQIGRTKGEFIECALDTMSQMIYYEDLTEELDALEANSIMADPAGFRRIAAHALATLAERADGSFTKLRMQLQIESRERELRRYLGSRSWRLTKSLRELNSRLQLSSSVKERMDSPEEEFNSIVSQPLGEDSYLLHLKRSIRKVRRSKSWQITAPIRWLEARLKPALRLTTTVREAKNLESLTGSKSEPQTQNRSTNPDSILVSVIVATWNRAHLLPRALASVQAQSHKNWECIIVDDGSVDDTTSVVEEFLKDGRFTFLGREHSGVCATRNAGLGIAKGSVIAYLDSDNIWFADYLTKIVAAYAESPTTQCVYTAQLVQNTRSPRQFKTRFEPWDSVQLRVDNFIDLNVFSHRKELLARFGAFDETLESLVDWDLVLRYTREGAVKALPIIGSLYFSDAKGRITESVDHSKSRSVITTSTPGGVAPSQPRVLYAMWQYPQLTQSYVETEIRAVRKLGVHVEVWAETDVAVAHDTEVRIHKGTIEEAIKKVNPQIVHTHWLHIAQNYEPMLEANNLPVTVRAHGFEMTPELVYALNRSRTIRKVFLFPDQMEQLRYRSDKLKQITAAFNENLYAPYFKKDRKLVLRVGASLWSKGYEQMMETALLCPDHEFLLILGTASLREYVVDEIVELNRKFGSPVKILHNIQPAEIKEIVKRAGIYMHTFRQDEPFGMSISIAESMATGAVILGYDRPEVRNYAGDAGFYFSSPEQAAELIKSTCLWSESDWQAAFCRSVDRAHSNFRSQDVFKTVVSAWQELLDESRGINDSAQAGTFSLHERGIGSNSPITQSQSPAVTTVN